jgi:hypothetical protein
LFQAVPLSLLAGALGNVGFGERASAEWEENDENDGGGGPNGGVEALVLVVGSCAAAGVLHGGLQRGLAQLFARLANRAAVVW